ncbi:MAG: serine/threonine protein phosphatase [Alphaproteobacteria bacterium]|nr:serine/threonine protein phosphatase [Alphaproteobacteria bacterium]
MVNGTVPVEVLAWRPAPFALAGETVFAIGDIHGCARELEALLAAIGTAASAKSGGRRLIFLGDLIDRGPDNLGVLRLWAEAERTPGITHIDRLMGNHEQLVLLAVTGGPHAEKAAAMWLSPRMGGEKVLEEMRTRVGDRDARPSAALLAAALGGVAVRHFYAMRSHVRLGNTVFVHAGLEPGVDLDEYLARPWMSFIEATWAWIQQGFLDWKGGFGGRLVVHGHTPPPKHRALTGQTDPHLFQCDRLGLDGGSALSGYVTAAEIEDGRYRILRAGTLMPDAEI